MIALFQILPLIKDRDFISQALGFYLKITISNLIEFMKPTENFLAQSEQNILNTAERIKDVRLSERKKAIKQTQLYENLNLRELFAKAFKVSLLYNF